MYLSILILLISSRFLFLNVKQNIIKIKYKKKTTSLNGKVFQLKSHNLTSVKNKFLALVFCVAVKQKC